MLRNATFKARAVALAGFAAVAAVGMALWQTDLLVARGFDKALEGARPTLSFQAKAGQTPAVAGDEGYWLTRAEVESPTPFVKPLALGDRITISGRNGHSHDLEIIDLKTIGTTLLPAANASGRAQPRLLIVTCRIVGDTGSQGPVRFIVEADAIEAGMATPAKTL